MEAVAWAIVFAAALHSHTEGGPYIAVSALVIVIILTMLPWFTT